LRWIDSFLSNRTQQVVVDNASSDIASVTSGLPQGTVLGPTLFLIYTSNIRLFADVCVLYWPISNHSDHIALQEDLSKLEKWSGKSLH
jgi:hypothetical protein